MSFALFLPSELLLILQDLTPLKVSPVKTFPLSHWELPVFRHLYQVPAEHVGTVLELSLALFTAGEPALLLSYCRCEKSFIEI